MRSSSQNGNVEQAITEVVRLAKLFGARGSVPATSGNFSVRASATEIAITRSGVDKSNLGPADVLIIPLGSEPPRTASAEAALHLALYEKWPDVGAVVHTHADSAAVLGLLFAEAGELRLTGWELLKAFRGITTHEAEVLLPIYPNTQNVPSLADRVLQHLPNGVYAYLIAGHGLYAWGSTPAEAERHAVAVEHLTHCELQKRMYKK
ncbi:MAG: methylthioribulose 1-phosphate dehydratase [Polyangiaceae bacterium]|nr:methylthioribulose 1-phosphate dehydratase [Polyangiaceae bacterium]